MAAIEEGVKRSKYHLATGLVPFILETAGRIGPAARAMVRRLAPTEPAARSAAISSLWQSISVILQKHNGRLILDAVQ